jgi:serine/threonine protein kinase
MSVIGEGAYGCVHKPSLKCKDKTLSYSDKISKLLLNEDANTEIDTYSSINKIDKTKKYYLGIPTKCNLKNDRHTLKSIKQCKKSSEILNNILDYSLLVMKYGGINLSDFSDKMALVEATPTNAKKMKKFWLEAVRLFNGIYTMDKHGLIHHDIKSDNIVYAESTNRVNYIDFGLMQKYSVVVKECQKSQYWLASKIHWSFPFEIMYLHKNKYMNFVNMSETEKMNLIDDIIMSFSQDNNYIANTIKVFYSTIITNKNSISEQYNMKMKLFDDFRILLLNEMKATNYAEFLKKSVRTIDTYGLGMTLLNVLNNTKHLIDSSLYVKLNELFYNMIHPNVFRRFDITTSLTEYENILKFGFSKNQIDTELIDSTLLLPKSKKTQLQTKYTLKRRPKRAT